MIFLNILRSRIPTSQYINIDYQSVIELFQKEVAERIYYEIQDIVKHQLELPNRDNYTISESFHNGDDVLNDDFYINHTNEHDRYSDSKNINNDFEIWYYLRFDVGSYTKPYSHSHP